MLIRSWEISDFLGFLGFLSLLDDLDEGVEDVGVETDDLVLFRSSFGSRGSFSSFFFVFLLMDAVEARSR